MRRRDIQALIFCLISTLVLAAATFLAFASLVLTGILVAAWLIFVFTRPRMIRLLRRLRGEKVDVFSYHKE